MHLVAVVLDPFLPALMLGLYAFIAVAAFQIGRPLLNTLKVQPTSTSLTAKRSGRALRGLKWSGLVLGGMIALAVLSGWLNLDPLLVLAAIGATIAAACVTFNLLRLVASPLFGRMETHRARKIAAGGSLLMLRLEALLGLALLVAAIWGGMTIGGILRPR